MEVQSTLYLHLHIAGAGEQMGVVEEPAAAEEPLVAGQLTHQLRRARRVAVVHVIHGAHIVHTTAC